MRDADIVFLQDILKYEDCMVVPTDEFGKVTPSTNYFGNATFAAVKKLQAKYPEILKAANVKNPTGNFGNSTRAFINAKYGTNA